MADGVGGDVGGLGGDGIRDEINLDSDYDEDDENDEEEDVRMLRLVQEIKNRMLKEMMMIG